MEWLMYSLSDDTPLFLMSSGLAGSLCAMTYDYNHALLVVHERSLIYLKNNLQTSPTRGLTSTILPRPNRRAYGDNNNDESVQ
jgi:hypothetical protein